jgi:exodeoxyribonuclease V beta subunit
VLVGRHLQATLARDALAACGVPAVIAGSGSVYATPAADDWLVLLEALEQPHRAGRVRAAALTPFLGRTAADLAGGGEGLTDELGAMLRTWSDLLTSRGVAALLEVATTDQGLMPHLLGLVDGERRLTDLRHVGQGLHAAAVEEGLGLAALVEWLRRRRGEAAEDASVERTRRLDSDAAAVQVVTLHASKGMEYPVVYLPFAFDRWVPTPDVLLLHDDDGHRVLDVGGPGTPGRRDRETRAASEQAGEELRLLYVGLTRAKSQAIVWWAPTTSTPPSGLHRLLFGRVPGASAVPEKTPLVSDSEAAQRLAELAARGGPVVEASVVGLAPVVVVRGADGSAMSVAVFDRALDTAWRRVSYSSLTAAGERATQTGVGSEPETGEREDEAVPGVPAAAAGDLALLAVPSPMADLPAGTAFGTLVHAILETTDPQAADLAAELRTRCREQLARRLAAVSADVLADALLPVLATPLGRIGGGLALRDLPMRDRLTEMDFELPLAGGDCARAGAILSDLAPLLRRHLDADDPLSGYADRLEAPDSGWQSLRGYLTGSLDAVLRLPGPRYVIADYKTNWLGDIDATPLSAWHYRPAALDAVMVRSHYPLQALLYSVALHRYLRWRQPAYDPGQHLGGVLYLYVRGMCGEATPVVDGRPCGVFGWRPPPALVVDLSALLDRGPS